MTSGAEATGSGPASDAEIAQVRRAVLWAAGALWRELPWRSTRDPWLVLVSEVMLQQTQAARVVAPYLRFSAAFPSPRACAEAGVGEVVRAWQGLGYNGRAVRLHRTAAALVELHGGRVPRELDALLALPGVGPYTARAVLAFAYEAQIGVVDTNVRRVLTRALAGRPLGSAQEQALADRLAQGAGAWQLNQALFDLGAQRCTARAPRCAGCPLLSGCRWRGGAHGGAVDPAAPGRRRQSKFHGSDRQGRGRLVDALRKAPVPRTELAPAAGWPGEDDRAGRVATGLVADGLAAWTDDALTLA